MSVLNDERSTSFDYPIQIKRLVGCDFDETYMPHANEHKKYSGIDELEDYIDDNNDKLLMVIGWITGSSIQAVLRKCKGYVRKLPHFIASSLGTELYWLRDGVLCESEEWECLIKSTGFVKENINKLVADLYIENIQLVKQIEDYQGKNMEGYYYYITDNLDSDFMKINEMAAKQNIKVLFTKCNPAAGDPYNCYDVAFMPKCCGKNEVLQFLAKSLDIAFEDIWAFGDSFNDYEVLKSVGNPFLVANADPAIKEIMPSSVLNSKYCYGIKEALMKIVINKGYVPNPIDTKEIKIPIDLIELSESMARNVHEVWAAGRMLDGWKYGTERNDKLKQHPCLVPYDELSEEEKEYDRRTSIETLKFIITQGFKIINN